MIGLLEGQLQTLNFKAEISAHCFPVHTYLISLTFGAFLSLFWSPHPPHLQQQLLLHLWYWCHIFINIFFYYFKRLKKLPAAVGVTEDDSRRRTEWGEEPF